MSPRSQESTSAIAPPVVQPLQLLKQPRQWLWAFWKFSRPHTIIGTTLSVMGIGAIAIADLPGLPSMAWVWIPLAAWVTCLCGNVYIVGLNQLEDVAIDRINKPHLPLASGEFSHRQGKTLVITSGVLAILLPLWQGGWLMATVWSSILIGTAYSLPPIRLKRFPFWASLCIFTVRGVVVNLGLFLHVQTTLQTITGQPTSRAIPPAVWLLTAFILAFTFAIAIFKDIPDLEGDRQYHITTLTVTWGQRAVFRLARWVITGCYVGMMVAAFALSSVNAPLLVGSHAVLLGWFWWASQSVKLSETADIARFYQFIWKLFFMEYLLFPLACLFT
jgi:homogentisate phytyltransferase/homogentisate geranylgeranyltransferase